MEPEKLNLSLTREDLQYVFGVLGRQPYVEVVNLIGSIQAQISQQLQPNAVAGVE
jgi:hypothetical protein